VAQGPAGAKVGIQGGIPGMEPPPELQLFTFLMTIICFLPIYRKKKTGTSFFLVLFYVFDDAVASRVVLKETPPVTENGVKRHKWCREVYHL